VSPYNDAYGHIHPNAVSDPVLTPSQPEHRVRAVPNRAITVDFPVVQTWPVGDRSQVPPTRRPAGSPSTWPTSMGR